MIKAIIVDDEQITRKGLLNYIDWKSLGIEIIGEATDGLEGLELAQNTSPDIAICDVKMPKMDGIKLAQHIRNILPQCKIIFLSGYSDKEYLKSAIQLKAVDYVEKPVNLEEFQELLRKTVEVYYEDRKKIVYFENSLLIHLTRDEVIDMDKVRDGSKLINVELPAHGRYVCTIFKLFDNQYKEELLNQINKELIKQSIKFIIGIEQNEIVIVSLVFSEESISEIKAICSTIVNSIYHESKLSVMAGIGYLAEGINEISRSYKEAKEALISIRSKNKNYVAVFDVNKDKAIIRSIEKYIQENYESNITLSSISSAVYLTPQYLCILYKKETGKTVNDYLTEVRMEAAKDLLKDPTLKLYQVADKVGYNDPNYFAKVFKKLVGRKPSEYRDRN